MSAPDRPWLSGVILAAGAAQRMGRPKALLPIGDRPMLQLVVDAAARARLDEIVLVLGPRAAQIRRAIRAPEGRRLQVATLADPAGGQSASLRAGLGAAAPHAFGAAVLLGDQPDLDPALIDELAERFLAGRLPALRPVYGEASGRRIPGHPVFLARRLWSEAEGLRGDEGARTLFHRHPEWLDEVPVAGPAPADLDTPEDYRRAAGGA